MRKLILKIIRYSGLPLIIRNTLQRNRVTILIFHDIGKEKAEMAFGKLRKIYNLISLDDYVHANRTKQYGKLPPKAMVITFDDAHKRNYEILPVIKKYKIPVTIYACASIVGTNRHFWVNHVKHNPDYTGLSNKERLKALSKLGFEQEKEYEKPDSISKNELDEMKEYVDFQSHTKFHPILPRCNNEEARDEILGSKNILEQKFGLDINSIAYPNGDYSDRDVELAIEAGYQSGLTIDFGYNDLDSDLFRLKRIGTGDTGDINELIVRSCGFWAFFATRNGKKQKYGFTSNVER